ncbi:MAG: tetratricopeptide repeat protein [Psychrobacter sp.]|uniref:tetratricopeptide repeat protein n=1 Tax=Psychrobacter sp. AOP7-B1-24 TaxID=3457645 RepID=UPI003FB6ABA0
MSASSASPITPFDYIADGYWQDFLAGRAIAGGIAYETELRNCTLDESLASLQRVDTLLSQIRREMIKVGQWDEDTLLVDERYRNFMMFLAFYAGRVLAQQWQSTPHWYGQFELHKRYPELPLITDDFYQHMAVIYRDASDINKTTSLFFALEPIGLRLFGHIDRPFEAVKGGQVASGLYQAVSSNLPISDDAQVAPAVSSVRAVMPAKPIIQNTSKSTSEDAYLDTAKAVSQNEVLETDSLTDTPAAKVVLPSKNESQSILSKVTSSVEEPKPVGSAKPKYIASAHPTSNSITNETETVSLSEQVPSSKTAPLSKSAPTPDMFTQLLIELNEIEVAQTSGHDEYHQSSTVLEQFEQHIAKQTKARAQVVFSESQMAAKKKALSKLQVAANAGNTAAMLRLAMYELLNEGLAADKNASAESGTAWVKQAASKNDSRAQRLLSKMYYQGIGVVQDIDNGKYWLEQAAENGHTEAAKIVMQWQQAQALITTQKQEQHSTKRYQLLLVAVIVVALLIILIV